MTVLDLSWDRLNPWCIRSKCGYWYIAKAKVGDEEYRYTLWKAPRNLIKTFRDPESAKREYERIAG